ncbi:DUF6193 family natural product biosynthesis protein [Kitasatospora sp. NPDC004615]|uniref:DUF6193 family natural product biosynthesis protein n=1 Tax=Kitasatospora sp. NPDC004615 TaxID=3364017 RepID=UPI00367926CE
MTEELPPEYAPHYPDVARAGSLRAALQAEADRAGLRLEGGPTETTAWRLTDAKVRSGERTVYVDLLPGDRQFTVACYVREVRMASGRTDDLAAVAAAVADWQRPVPVRELVTRRPFLGTWELAEAHERGEPIPVRWKQLLANRNRRTKGLREFIEAAHAEPRLRALSPGMAMWWVTFSRRAEDPISHDLPMVRPLGEDRFEVRHRAEDRPPLTTTGVAATVAAVLDLLPEDAVPEPHLPMI